MALYSTIVFTTWYRTTKYFINNDNIDNIDNMKTLYYSIETVSIISIEVIGNCSLQWVKRSTPTPSFPGSNPQYVLQLLVANCWLHFESIYKPLKRQWFQFHRNSRSILVSILIERYSDYKIALVLTCIRVVMPILNR